MSTLLGLQPGSLPSGYCWPSPQQYYNDIFAIGSAVFGGDFTVFNYGASIPAAENTGFPWLRVVNGVPDSWYVYDNGVWKWPYPVPYLPAGSTGGVRWLWAGTTAELETWDGGAAGAVSATTGPFWEVDTDFAARSLMGVGVLADSGTNITVGFNYGNERQTLTTNQLPSHTHTIANVNNASANNNASGTGTGAGNVHTDSSGVTDATGGGLPVSIVHPVRGIYVIKRTARIYKVV